MISLGLLVDVPLDTARRLAADARDLLSQGIDPSADRQNERVALKLTFEAVARQWLTAREALLQKGAITPPHVPKATSVSGTIPVPRSRFLPAETYHRPGSVGILKLSMHEK